MSDIPQHLIDAAAGREPTPIDLIGAPTIERWQLSHYPGTDLPCLIGYVTGHPRLPDGPSTTRPLVAIDVGAWWARTEGRYYRLGAHVAGRLAGQDE